MFAIYTSDHPTQEKLGKFGAAKSEERVGSGRTTTGGEAAAMGKGGEGGSDGDNMAAWLLGVNNLKIQPFQLPHLGSSPPCLSSHLLIRVSNHNQTLTVLPCLPILVVFFFILNLCVLICIRCV